MPGKNPREAVDYFVGYIRETLNCVTDETLLVYQESDNIYAILFRKPVLVKSADGGRFYLSIRQKFTVQQREDGLFKVHTREYSYVFSASQNIADRIVLSYHWHPNDFDLRDPHLHLTITPELGYPEVERRIARAHYPTSRVCVEDFILLLFKYYDIRPRLADSKWKPILKRNKAAFSKMATWFV